MADTSNGVVILITLLNILVYKLRKLEESLQRKHLSLSVRPLCRRFSLREMQSATNNFSEELMIGKGGFGIVYKGIIDSNDRIVAIKRSKAMSKQGRNEFLTEIEMLSQFQHSHIISLVGYCDENEEMILVYNYMSSGSLADHLHKRVRKGETSLPSLSWVQRLKICVGAAHGLNYLHTGTGIDNRVIHRDVKTSNILLDENFAAKISDFGLSKQGPANQTCTHVSTRVKGTHGYLDPYYVATHRLTRKSDVYAFGVVLFEVLCGRPAVDTRLEEEQINLAGWAEQCYKEGRLDQIMDSNIKADISSDSLNVYVDVAIKCLHNQPKLRPTMAEVVVGLESALTSQEKSTHYTLVEIMPSDYSQENMDSSILEVNHTKDNREFEYVGEGHVDVWHRDKKFYGRKKFKKRASSFLLFGARVFSGYRSAKTSIYNNGVLSENSNKSQATKHHPMAIPVYASLPPTLGRQEHDFQSSKLKCFKFNDLNLATRKFSPDSVVGQGGFGRVYKGWIDENTFGATEWGTGLAIAVKSLDIESLQGHKEWLAEINYLGTLSHPNLVKLIGYCLEEEHRLLVYEFMPHGSLENHLFRNSTEHSFLNWETRYKIISGVAKGLLYLHEDSRLCIIHRDLKPSNVLLDEDMNPKISDFGMARLCGINETQGNTSRIVGTYGYMAPEYAMYGRFSVKSDVFSFGVLILEIVSGQKINCFQNGMNIEDMCMTSAVWKNWQEGNACNVIDPILKNSSESIQEIMRCIHIGLLCVQKNVTKRPTMASVMHMLNSFSLTLALPSKPAFLMHSRMDEDTYCSSMNDMSSQAKDKSTDNSITNVSVRLHGKDFRSSMALAKIIKSMVRERVFSSKQFRLFLRRQPSIVPDLY